MTDLTSAAVETVLDAGASRAAPNWVNDADEAIAALYTVPQGYEVQTVELEEIRAPYRARPARKRGTVHVATVATLLVYHAKHATENAEIWVSRDGVIVDVLNAHGMDSPEWGDHRAVLRLEPSPEWLRWSDISGSLCTQEFFAEFLEGAAVDVLRPDMATMLEVAQSLNANTRVEYESSYRTKDGQRALVYKETTTARAGQRGELEIPERITLAVRVFEGQEPQEVDARFRYRIDGDQLKLGIVIDRIPELLEQARLAVLMEIASEIDRGVVLSGTPS